MTSATVTKQFKIIDQDTLRMGVSMVINEEQHKFWDAEQYFMFCYHNNISTTHYKDQGDMVRPISVLSPQWCQ